MKTFLFYDIETSGLNPAFDQVLTFASIRTDTELNEIDRESITVQLRKDIVPSPAAFLTHGLTFDELSQGICEYDAALKIHTLVNTPGTVSIGYNSLGFDDEFLRFLFYRNLLDPYVHQYGNGCSRMDVLPMAVIYKVFHPEGVKWPTVEGKPSLKLENISKENQFITSGKAHEAMSDVEALIGLSRMLQKKSDIWNYCCDFFNKTRDEVRINHIETAMDIASVKYPMGLMVSAALGPENNYLAPVIHIGSSKSYRNQNLWLRLDSDELSGLDTDMNLEDTFVTRKRYGDTPIILPALERFWNRLTQASQDKVQKNIKILNAQPVRFKSLIEYHRTFKYPFVPNVDSDADLYQAGFFSSQEKKESQLFHQLVKNNDLSDLNQIKSDRIRQLAHRIINRNFHRPGTEFMGEDFSAYFHRLISISDDDAILGYRGDVKFNLENAKKEIADLINNRENMSEDQAQMVKSLDLYVRNFNL